MQKEPSCVQWPLKHGSWKVEATRQRRIFCRSIECHILQKCISKCHITEMSFYMSHHTSLTSEDSEQIDWLIFQPPLRLSEDSEQLIYLFFKAFGGFLTTVNNWFFYFSRLFEAFWRQWIDRSRLSEDVSSFIFILYYIFEDVSEMVLKKGHTFWFVLVNCPTHQPTCFAHSHLITIPKWDIWKKQSRAIS